MKQNLIPLLFLLLVARPLAAAETAPAASPEAVYRQRADKIVAVLALGDADKTARVRDAIAEHYRGVNVIDDAVDVRVKELKQQSAADKASAEAAIKTVQAEAEPKLAKLHAEFLAKLSTDLTPAQVDQVKDGLTYSILPVTFGAYQKMLPDLTPEQRAQILAWLTEAREHAMDAGSSEAKHAWFGKYKGKISNYLSKAGYNMKEAEKNLTKKP